TVFCWMEQIYLIKLMDHLEALRERTLVSIRFGSLRSLRIHIRLNSEGQMVRLSQRSRAPGPIPFTVPPLSTFATAHWMRGVSSTSGPRHLHSREISSEVCSAALLKKIRRSSSAVTKDYGKALGPL